MISLETLINAIHHALRQGTNPEKIVVSVTLGVVLGVFPIPGVATVLCALFAVVLRLNHGIIQVVNYGVYPLQILLLGGYIALGNIWFDASNSTASFDAMVSSLQNDVWSGLLAVKQIGFGAIAAWLATSPLLAIVVHFSSRYAIKRTKSLADVKKSKAIQSQTHISAFNLRTQAGCRTSGLGTTDPILLKANRKRIRWTNRERQVYQNKDCEQIPA